MVTDPHFSPFPCLSDFPSYSLACCWVFITVCSLPALGTLRIYFSHKKKKGRVGKHFKGRDGNTRYLAALSDLASSPCLPFYRTLQSPELLRVHWSWDSQWRHSRAEIRSVCMCLSLPSRATVHKQLLHCPLLSFLLSTYCRCQFCAIDWRMLWYFWIRIACLEQINMTLHSQSIDVTALRESSSKHYDGSAPSVSDNRVLISF